MHFAALPGRDYAKVRGTSFAAPLAAARVAFQRSPALSLQLHHHRSEHWVVVRGAARVTLGESVFDLPQGASTFIPVETKHRLENRGSDVLAVIEVACGDYIEEDDIIRFDDRYGRTKG